MKSRLRAWLRDELTRVVRSELSTTSTTLETKIETGLADLNDEIARERAAVEQRDAQRDQDLAGAVAQLAQAITALTERIDADADERQLHLASVEWLMRELVIGFPAAPLPATATIVGGTIERDHRADERPGLDYAPTIDLRDDELTVGMRVEVRSRFHERWIHGFEILEIIQTDEHRRYRLTRLSDKMALPVLFDEADLRPLVVLTEFEIDDQPV